MTLLSLSAVLWPVAVRAQQPARKHRLAVLTLTEPAEHAAGAKRWVAFFEELRRLGYENGRNLIVEWRSMDGNVGRANDIAAEILDLKPDLVFTPDLRVITSLKATGTTLPIVVVAPDPVGMGFGASLARPGGNVTGFDIAPGIEIIAKRVELLKEAVPTATRLAWLAPRLGVGGSFLEVFSAAARRLGLSVVESLVEPPYDEAAYRRSFATLSRDKADLLYVAASGESLAHRRLIAELAAAAGLPTMFVFREHVEAGGLMAYSVDLVEIFRRSAGYIDRILKGASPAEMPFQQPTRFELVMNANTARALGIAVSDSLLARVDEIIQ